MRTIIFTGNGGTGIALAAAATACMSAQAGNRTLLVSIGPSHSLGALFNIPTSAAPQAVAPNLEIWTIDALADLSMLWNQARSQLSGPSAQISGDEIPLLPGSDLFLGMTRIRQQTANNYDLLIIDAGPHDGLLRALSVPDSFRWFVRLMFGLDRGPGRSNASIGRAIVPATLIPFDWVGYVQNARVQLEQARDNTIDHSNTSTRYVLRPDSVALDEARLAVPALYLHGLVVDAIVAGPALPADIADPRLASLIMHQCDTIAAAEQIWAPRPLLHLPVRVAASVEDLGILGAEMYAERLPMDVYETAPPIEQSNGSTPFIAINLPGLRRESLSLTISGDELIVRAGPYRRHLLLPEALRGTGSIKASREGERLVVRLRQEG
ncbi:MAG: chromosome partitioning protein [Chloroflexales bacterium]|nr:chromosome partitioning protein [Chloroflexales bacterium]